MLARRPAAAVRRSCASPPVTPSAHQVEPPLRGALGVERQPGRARVGAVVPELSARSNCCSPSRDERPPLRDRRPLKPCHSRKPPGRRRSPARARPRSRPGQVDRAGAGPGLGRRRRAERGAVQTGQRDGRPCRATPSAPGAGRSRRGAASVTRPATACPAVLANATSVPHASRSSRRSLQTAGGVDERRDHRGPLVRRGVGGRVVPVAGGGRAGPAGEAGVVRGRPAAAGRRPAVGHERAAAPSPRRRRRPVGLIAVRPSTWTCSDHASLVVDDVLVDERLGEAGQRRGLAGHVTVASRPRHSPP